MLQVNLMCIKTIILVAVSVLFLSSCSQKTTVVLLPDPDGAVGSMTIYNDAGSVDITEPGAATVVSGKTGAPSDPKIMEESEIASTFGDALAVLPDPPEHFILYFMSGSTELREESLQLFPDILDSIRQRESQAISVIGHTDTAGDAGYNFRLSKKRAERIRELLISRGVELRLYSSHLPWGKEPAHSNRR